MCKPRYAANPCLSIERDSFHRAIPYDSRILCMPCDNSTNVKRTRNFRAFVPFYGAIYICNITTISNQTTGIISAIRRNRNIYITF